MIQILQNPVNNITQNTNSDQNQNDTNPHTNQDNTSTLSTSDTHITQPFQAQHLPAQNYDPPHIPPQ